MLTLQIVVCSTRPGRKGPAIAAWMEAQARRHDKFTVELVDLAEVNLPLFDEPKHPRLQQYEHEHTRRWAAIVDRADAYVFVTPEYDYGPPASLLNALQFLLKEWEYKAAGFASYGGVSAGTRGVQMTKQVITTLGVMPLPQAVSLPFFAKSLNEETGVFDPGETQEKAATLMLDELHKWAAALKPLRA